MMLISKDELLEALEKKFGDLNDESGCSIRTENGWSWLSVKVIADLIDDCEEFED